MKVKAVVFDFDGTLAKTDKYLFTSLAWLIKNRRLIPKRIRNPFSLLAAFFQANPEMFLLELHRLSGKKVSKQEIKDIMDLMEKIIEESATKASIHKHAIELIPKLKEQGYVIVISSLASRKRIEEALKKHGLLEHIDFIVSKENSKNRTTRLRQITRRLEKEGIKPNEILFVGDMPTDVKASRAAGVRSAVVLRNIPGIRSVQKQLFKRYGTKPDHYLSSLKDLHDILKTRKRR